MSRERLHPLDALMTIILVVIFLWLCSCGGEQMAEATHPSMDAGAVTCTTMCHQPEDNHGKP